MGLGVLFPFSPSLIKNLKAMTNPAGGLFYHYKALRLKRSFWSPFIHPLNQWLRSWSPPQRELIIIGPSGGYSLEPSTLTSFEKIHCIDPDPLAAWIFRRRFSSWPLEWHYEDFFGINEQTFRPEGLSQILNLAPQAAVLFSNFLGQVPVLLAPQFKNSQINPNWRETWKQTLQTQLHQRSWASYHDLYSFSGQQVDEDQVHQFLEKWKTNEIRPTPEDLKNLFSPSQTVTITNHLTHDLLPKYHRQLFFWPLHPDRHHLIEGCYQRIEKGISVHRTK